MELKSRIEDYIISNKEELRVGFLTKVCTQFKNELLSLHNKKIGYDEMISYILTLKYKHIN